LNLTPGDPLLERIDLHYNKLQLFKEILSDANNADKWKRWQQLEQWCLKDSVSVIKHLVLSAQFDLAARVATQFRVTSMKKDIEEQFLLHLLNDTHGTYHSATIACPTC
jgi:phage-related protein